VIFQTYWFIAFGVVFFPVYWLLGRAAWRRIWLMAGCLVFHFHFAGPAGMLPIIILGVLVYLAGLSANRKLCLAVVGVCVAALVGYKYTLFLGQQLAGWLPAPWGGSLQDWLVPLLPAAAPLAISFFTFEFVHYLTDVARGCPPIRRADDFLLFSIFFPSLVAGPIKRYQSFIPAVQLEPHRLTLDDVQAGLARFALGACKKIVIADNLTLGVNFWAQQPFFEWLSPAQLWLWFAALALRIYLDFSGYSDMAIGLSRMMGIRLPENFNHPYAATSLQDFWQRWHISLSTWIRDYVYIPLGGGRLGLPRRVFNGMVAFGLCGLWHGAAWNFVLWGLWHGVGLAINASYARGLGASGRFLARIMERFPVLGWLITLLHVTFGWLLFFYEPAQAWYIAGKLLRF